MRYADTYCAIWIIGANESQKIARPAILVNQIPLF